MNTQALKEQFEILGNILMCSLPVRQMKALLSLLYLSVNNVISIEMTNVDSNRSLKRQFTKCRNVGILIAFFQCFQYF